MEKKLEMNLFGKNTKGAFSKWYSELTTLDKRMLFGFLGLMIIVLMFNLTLDSIQNYNSEISPNECNRLRAGDVAYYLSLQEENNVLAFIYSFQYPFKLFMVAIAIAWILHGVGFHIIKR